MEKKRVFISMHYLELGGAEISLIGLLNAMDYSRYDVDLFLYSQQGELMGSIPVQTNLLPEIPAYKMYEQPLKEVVKKGFFGVAFGRLLAKLQYWLYCRRKHPKEVSAVFSYVMRAVEPFLPSLEFLGEYDLAISFLTPHNVVLKKVKAKKKVAWIHTDYSKIDVDAELELPIWTGYDFIASISKDVTRTFLTVFPSLADRIVLIENIMSSKYVRERSEQLSEDEVRREMPKQEGVTNILSVGRYYLPKRFEYVPAIVNHMRNHLHENIRWYIIGYGIMEKEIKNAIEDAGMQDHVILLGKKSNPYPYMKGCDIYAQPSLFEGKSVTVREAQMLGKSVIVTNYPTASSQINDGLDGVIVPMDVEECAVGIVKFIKNIKLREQIEEYNRSHDFGNESEVNKVYALLENDGK